MLASIFATILTLLGPAPAPALTSTAVPGCYRPAAGELILQQGQFSARAYGGEVRYSVFAVATKSRRHAKSLGVSQTDLLIWTPGCTLAYRQTFGGAPLLRFEEARLGTGELLHVIALYPGGSGSRLQHLLLAMDVLTDPQPLAPISLAHSNMGGFFVGDLGAGRGPGIALWDAEWSDGGHYSPHPATLIMYRWRGGHFIGPERLRTRGHVPAEPDAAPAALGLPFRDSTRDDLFYSAEALAAAPSVP